MISTAITVRPLASPEERELHLQWSDREFPLPSSPPSVLFWHRFATTLPGFHPEQMRGAFRGGEQVGGYIIYRRMLRVGAAELATGCISAVVTYANHRFQGVATALMYDAIDYALSHNFALLLLDGIPKFYHRYGYSDVFDISTQDIDRSSILVQSPSTYTVRPALLDDADTLLALYNRNYGSYTGSFVRSMEEQIYWLKHRWPKNPVVLAVDPVGQSRGYLSLAHGPDHSRALEIVADDWPATLALLQYHAKLLDGPEAPAVLHYRLPPTAPELQWMIDYLEVPNTSLWKSPADEWTVRCHSYHQRDTGWMARLVHLPTLVQAMLPEWQARWRRSLARWSGYVSLIVGEEECTFYIDGSELRLVDQPLSSANIVRLTPQVFIQLVFSYRPITWALHRCEQSLSSDMLSVLNTLFRYGNTWIPTSDGF